jgi:hypothetical protein
VQDIVVISSFVGNNRQFFGISEINMIMGDTRLLIINTADYSQINSFFSANKYINTAKL